MTAWPGSWMTISRSIKTMTTAGHIALSIRLLSILTLLCLPPAIAQGAAPALLHNSNQFACGYSGFLTQGDCEDHGGEWNPSRKWPQGWGIAGGQYSVIDCATCHAKQPGNANIKRLRSVITADSGSFAGGAVTALSAIPGVSSDYGDDSGEHASSERVCEVCHSRTRYHRFDTTNQVADGGNLGHFNGSDCVSCHRHKAGFRAGCADCHGNSGSGAAWPDGLANNLHPQYAQFDDGGSHLRHVDSLSGNNSCGSCHPLPEAGTTHLNETLNVQGEFTYAQGPRTCGDISCHSGTAATWGGTGCLACHGVSQGQRAAVSGQFAANSHHIQGITVTDSHCFACHWEAKSDGSIDPSYHGGSTAPGAVVDLVVYGAGTRPLVHTPGDSAVQYRADGSRAEIAKLNEHCLGCHSDQNSTAEPFGDGKTPQAYAWDGTSIAARYSQNGTTTFGKYPGVANAAPKNQLKAYSAHGNAPGNHGGWSEGPAGTGVDGALPNTRNGLVNVACCDCHNAHGSNVVGKTTSYASTTVNGGILKDTAAGKGGYAVSYKPVAGGSLGEKNLRNPGASLCFDCHLTASAGPTTPWGYQSTFGATAKIAGYYDSPYFAPGGSGTKSRYPYKAATNYAGGHFGASSDLETPAMAGIDGLCTPCHDPHGVSPTLGVDQQYGVPLLKGTWLTSPYQEDVAPAANSPRTGAPAPLGAGGDNYHIDQNTFGGSIHQLVAGITQTENQFAGLCLNCHPKSSLTDGVTHTWKSKDRIHESVAGWKTSPGTAKHRYTCSKCHSPHSGTNLPRLMVTNCMDWTHKGRTAGSATPAIVNFSEAGEGWGVGRLPGVYEFDNVDPGLGYRKASTACHETQNGHARAGTDQLWNLVTPWEPALTISGLTTGVATVAGAKISIPVRWTTTLPSDSMVDYGLTTDYGATAGGSAEVSSHNVPILLDNHATYHYRAHSRTYNGQHAVSGDKSLYVSFPPTVPGLIPEPDAQCAMDCSVTLEWNAATDPVDNGPIEYYGELSNNPGFSPIVAGSGWITGTTWEASLPQTNTTYYWRVKSRDANHTTAQDPPSAWTPTDIFVVADGNAPQVGLTSPGDYSTHGGYDGSYLMNFSWSASPPGQAFLVEVSTDATFATVNKSSGWVGTSSWGTTLTHPSGATTVYYWRVQGKLFDGTTGPWSTVRTFSILDYGSSSCPFLFVWNGEEFVFEADLYGAGKLATKTKTGYLKPEPHDYYVLNNRPAAKAGVYELRLVEERYEINYLDELKFYAVDAPNNRRVFTEKPQAGGTAPFSELGKILHTISTEARVPSSIVHINTGENVTEKLAADDAVYVLLNEDKNIDFTYQTLELDLGDIQQAPRVKIAMDAMSMFPDSPEGVARSATFGARTILEVQDEAGKWVKVPAEKGALPKAPEFSRPYVFDISDIWISDSRKVRFTFLFKTYVDWILVDTTENVPVTITEVPMLSAQLGQRGIDPKTSDDDLYEYVYGEPTGRTAYLPGNYTRLGGVLPLLSTSDDQFVIYGGGDEIAMTFAPPGGPGPVMKRTFLVYTNGYYKDTKVDVPHTVEPLPFAGMSNFPYDEAVEHYPDNAEHENYREVYNTRGESP